MVDLCLLSEGRLEEKEDFRDELKDERVAHSVDDFCVCLAFFNGLMSKYIGRFDDVHGVFCLLEEASTLDILFRGGETIF